ncbi:MAG: hypothetical protein HFE85_03640 [Clostridiales bacterium]|nr:hypothetical protein [Clostridiales bacterium]
MLNFQKHYESAVRNIKVPDDLKEDTVSRLQMERRFGTDSQHKWLKRAATACASLMVVIAAALLIPIAQQLMTSTAGTGPETTGAYGMEGSTISIAPQPSSEYEHMTQPASSTDGEASDVPGEVSEGERSCLYEFLEEEDESFRQSVDFLGGKLNFTRLDFGNAVFTNVCEESNMSMESIWGYDYYKSIGLPLISTDRDQLPIPKVPDDLKYIGSISEEDQDATRCVDRDGNVLCEYMAYLYLNMDEDINTAIENPFSLREVYQTFSKDEIPGGGDLSKREGAQPSIINGEKVWVNYERWRCTAVKRSSGGIAAEDDPTEVYEVFRAEFVHKGIGYRITTCRLNQAEFLTLLESLLTK